MKTRSNMPLFVVETNDVKALSNSQIDLLRCGDYLVKKDASGEHAYKVTYKKDGVGMCLSYHDASCVETVSYDYTNGNWVYNSTDKADLPINVEDASFKPIYCHPIEISKPGLIIGTSLILNNNNTLINSYDKLLDAIKTFGNVNGFARLHIAGSYYDSDLGLIILSEIAYNFESEIFNIVGMKTDGSVVNNINITNLTSVNVVDSVNKIN